MPITMLMFNSTNERLVQRGAAMVEFAIILPIMVVIVFGITEIGRAIYQQNTLSKALASGVRYMSRSWQTVDDDCSQLGSWGSETGKAANLVAFGSESGGGTPLLPELDPGDVSFDVISRVVPASGDTNCVIVGSVSVPFQSIFGESVVPFLDLDPILLSATVEERYHGE